MKVKGGVYDIQNQWHQPKQLKIILQFDKEKVAEKEALKRKAFEKIIEERIRHKKEMQVQKHKANQNLSLSILNQPKKKEEINESRSKLIRRRLEYSGISKP